MMKTGGCSKSKRWIIGLGVLSSALLITVIVLAVLLAGENNSEGPISSTSESSSQTSSESTTVMTSTEPPALTEPWEINYRLPTDTLPIHYDISLHPDFTTDRFSGVVYISITTTAPRNFLLVHTKFLNISSTHVYGNHVTSPGADISIGRAFEYAPNEFWVIQLNDQLPAGNYTIHLEFNGSLNRGDIVGFYRSTYKNDKGELRPIATSKFEPTYARRAFPCMDEPSFKSTFTVSLVRPTDGYVAYSNMPEEGSEADKPSAGLTTVHFQKSVKMVTYLACFIVCDFEERIGETVNNKIPFRVISRPDQIKSTEYPLDVGIKVTDYYEDYFGLRYALPKQDMIAIPDFVSGAMEHWGLVTYRETALLYNPTESSTANQKRVATVIAHELAHQWFGNLMTVRWWDDLWLNEGFASYMEYKGTNDVHPDWDIETQMLTDDIQVVFRLDAKLSSHPIVQTVNHPDEITELFDTISYSKGASVLRMLEHFMGKDNFQLGIQKFLKDYEFDNAATPDLWNSLQNVTPDLNISRIMDTWTRQMGFPVLQYTIDGGDLVVTQSRFLADPTNSNNQTIVPSPFNYKWDVPISFKTDKSPDAQIQWLKMEDANVRIPLNGATWIKLNAGQDGFFRVNYNAAHWEALRTALANNVSALDPADRWGIIDDAFSLAAAGSLSYETALAAAEFLKNDRHPVPWISASDKLTSISSLVYSTSLYPGFRKYIISLLKDTFAELGWDPVDGHLNKTLQTTIISLACASGYDDCLNGAATRFDDWIRTGTPIHPDFRTLVYRYGMSKVGDATSWNIMWERFRNEGDPQESIKLIYGLAFPQEPWLIQQYLEYAKNDAYVRSQDYFTVLEYISQNPVGLPIVWDFVRTEWKYLVDRFTLNNRYLGRMVNTVASRFTTELRLNEMKAFFAQYPEAGAGARARQEALENVQNNIRWIANYKQVLGDWLENNGFNS